jgi:hypothetical protein
MAAETPSNDTYEMVGQGLRFRFDLAWNQGLAGYMRQKLQNQRQDQDHGQRQRTGVSAPHEHDYLLCGTADYCPAVGLD